MKKAGLIALMTIVTLPAFAAGRNVNSLLKEWSNPPPAMSYCLAGNIGNACIGNSLSGCKNWNGAQKNQPNRGTYDDEMATLMLIARDVTANGAKFCVTSVQGANKNKGDAWTTYYNPQGNVQSCFWLCKPGFYGEKCTSSGASPVCDATTIKASDFSSTKFKIATSNAPSVEGEIAMFYADHYRGCGVEKGQEHDMVLGIIDWTASGHGAFAQPMVVRAERAQWKDMVSTATIWTVGEKTLLCKDGYQPNAAKTDCVAANQTLCNMNNMCNNWSSSSYVEGTHKLVASTSGTNCYEYRCAMPNMAFTTPDTKSCSECVGDARVGVAPNGVCTRCPMGKLFDATAVSGNYCRETTAYSVQDLAYGRGKDRNAPNPCWTIAEPTEYKACVTGVAPVATSADDG